MVSDANEMPPDDRPERFAAFLIAFKEHFGDRALDIAKRQLAQADEEARDFWERIVSHLYN